MSVCGGGVGGRWLRTKEGRRNNKLSHNVRPRAPAVSTGTLITTSTMRVRVSQGYSTLNSFGWLNVEVTAFTALVVPVTGPLGECAIRAGGGGDSGKPTLAARARVCVHLWEEGACGQLMPMTICALPRTPAPLPAGATYVPPVTLGGTKFHAASFKAAVRSAKKKVKAMRKSGKTAWCAACGDVLVAKI